jgi:hypothetical protein
MFLSSGDQLYFFLNYLAKLNLFYVQFYIDFVDWKLKQIVEFDNHFLTVLLFETIWYLSSCHLQNKYRTMKVDLNNIVLMGREQ